MYKVVLTDDRYGDYTQENEVLAAIGSRVEIHNLEDEEEALRVLKDAEGILVNLFPLTGRIIRGLERCKVISRYGVGYDNVDIQAAAEKGIQVTRVPDYCHEEVSDHALALLLSCIRQVPFKDRKIRSGEWNLHSSSPCFRIRGQVLGIVGYGGVGKLLHKKMSGFGLERTVVYDPYIPTETVRGAGALPVDFETLLRESDYISVHAPLTEETSGLFDARVFSLMERRPVFINTSRGGLVDENALCGALDSGLVSAAGIDVFSQEPLPMESGLRRFDNVVLSDHTAWYSEESLVELKTKAARNILEVLSGKEPTYPVPPKEGG